MLHVDDIEGTVARLGDLVFEGPLDRPAWGIKVAYLRDPAGTLIELNEDLARPASGA